MRYPMLCGAQPLPDTIPSSPLDSARFGMQIGRLTVSAQSDATPKHLRTLLRESNLDLVILRYPSDRVTWFSALRDPAWTLLHADTLMYYKHTLTPSTQPPPNTRRAHADDHLSIANLVRATFDNYTNHYAANPDLSATHRLDGYIEWAQNYALPHPEQRACVLYESASTPQGFVTFDIADTSEIALIGTHPDHAGRGIAADLMRAAEHTAQRAGSRAMVISTQAQNTRVQRVWSRLGYLPELAMNTLHITLRAS